MGSFGGKSEAFEAPIGKSTEPAVSMRCLLVTQGQNLELQNGTKTWVPFFNSSKRSCFLERMVTFLEVAVLVAVTVLLCK